MRLIFINHCFLDYFFVKINATEENQYSYATDNKSVFNSEIAARMLRMLQMAFPSF